MANAYTGGYEGISSNELPEAEKMRSALNSLEKMEHKISTAEWDTNKTSKTKYPVCAAVQKAVNEAWVYPVTDPDDFLSNRSRLPSAGAVYRFVESTEKDIEKKANIVTAAGWEANKNNETKYPSCAAVSTAVSVLAVTLAQTISGASTNAQIPSAQAVWKLRELAKHNILTFNASPYTGVKLRKFEIKTSVSSTLITWYNAVRLGVAATLSAGDVPQSVKDHINTTWRGNNITDASCLAYLRYAHRTPGVWRLPTEAEWVYGRKSGMFWYTAGLSGWEWCCDAYGNGSNQAIMGVNPVYWGSDGNRVRRHISNDTSRHQLHPAASSYGGGNGWGSGAYGTVWCRLARTVAV